MSKVYKFSEFVLDRQALAFYRRNEPVQLSLKAFQVLVYLIEKRGEVVGKDELLDKVWKDSFVEESNLAVHISALRRVLQEKKGDSRFIRTISGVGYSFVAEVEELDAAQGVQRAPEIKNGAKSEIVSIAVLPFSFADDSADHEYLANGVTQSLIGDLSKAQNLRVIAYSAVKAYKDSPLDLTEIAFQLGAERILTGGIAEFKGKWEITAELIDARDKSCLWAISKTFDAEDIFEVKREISATIAASLRLGLVKNDERREPGNEAQRLYYRGKFILESRTVKADTRETLYQALKFFKEAVRRDPHYALAFAGIGSVYCSLRNHSLISFEAAHAEVKKALDLALSADAQLSEAYILQGSARVFFEFDFTAALDSFETGARLSPSNADAYHWKSLVLTALGRFDEAIRLEKKAIELDPITGRFHESLIRIFFFAGRYNEALNVAEEVLEFAGDSITAHYMKAKCYAELGFFELALTAAEKTVELRASPDLILFKAYVLARFGHRNEARQVIEEVSEAFAPKNVDDSDYAAYYAALGETERAFEYLNKAVDGRVADLVILKHDKRFTILREDARFQSILERLNLI